MSTVTFKRKGNKQIALRVEPSLKEGMQQALKADGDATLSAWIKRLLRREQDRRDLSRK